MRSVVLCLMVCLCPLTFGQAVTSPKQGSAARKGILDALRVPIEKDLKQRVMFKVDHLKVSGNWAFMSGKNLTAAGKKIDYRKTRYKDAIDSGAFDDWTCALLKREGNKWKVLRYSIGATDVVWDGWFREFRAPKAIFPYGN